MNRSASFTSTRPATHLTAQLSGPLMILVTGPTDLRAAHMAARTLFGDGHLPLVGADLTRGFTTAGPGDISDAALHPVLLRLLTRSDAVLRIAGASPAADMVVRLAQWEGKPVYYRLGDVPVVGDHQPGSGGI